jgi:hypothetical protein
MRSLSQVSLLRLACAFAVSAYVTFGVIGCGGTSAPETGTSTQLAPEAVKANNSMEEFEKSKKK